MTYIEVRRNNFDLLNRNYVITFLYEIVAALYR